MTTQTEATKLVKTFGKPNESNPDSATVADVNLPLLQVDGTKLDIIIGMFDSEGVIASKEVKETLAVVVLESAKALQMDVDDLIKFSNTQPGKVSMTAFGVGMINQVRPSTSQMGFTIPSITSAKTELVNRNIIA
tara:strand:- start:3 stop:407 length:405 start_codon:yes stop_codon:yes gene_type:complete